VTGAANLSSLAGRHGVACGIVAAYQPDVAILDFCMPRLTALEVARELRRGGADPAVVILTLYAEEPRIVAALEAGVRGYAEKNRAPDDLIPAIYAVAEGRVYLSPRLDYLCSTHGGSEDFPPGPLSGARPHRHAPGSVPRSEVP